MKPSLKKKRSPFGKSNSTANRSHRNPRKPNSTIRLDQLVKEARPVEIKSYESSRRIDEMPIADPLKKALAKKGFLRPTEIQDKSIEHLLQGKDLLGIAQTGTGKTGAFLIPIIHKLITGNHSFQTLVLVPTRELAVQVEEEFRSMTSGLNLYSACFIGGTNINKDLSRLRRSSHVIIGTPGRLLDLNKRRAIDFRKFEVLIVDEFDRMLDMGFLPDVQRITRSMTDRKQTMLFSATIDRSQQQMIDELLTHPVEVRVSTGAVTGDHIEQNIVRIGENDNKIQVLLNMLNNVEFKKVLVFAETKRGVHKLCAQLKKSGINADEIHGNKTQASRQKALDNFKRGVIQVLVATDVAARGLDVSDVTHVINYQLPANFDSYIHRIGRTGRAGKGGNAYTFVG